MAEVEGSSGESAKITEMIVLPKDKCSAHVLVALEEYNTAYQAANDSIFDLRHAARVLRSLMLDDDLDGIIEDENYPEESVLRLVHLEAAQKTPYLDMPL